VKSAPIVIAVAGRLAVLLGLFLHLIQLWGQNLPHEEN
jgi:hypothetical protein